MGKDKEVRFGADRLGSQGYHGAVNTVLNELKPMLIGDVKNIGSDQELVVTIGFEKVKPAKKEKAADTKKANKAADDAKEANKATDDAADTKQDDDPLGL